MKKRGQTTVFIVIGVVIVLIALLVVYLDSKKIIGKRGDDFNTNPVSTFIESCLETNLKAGVNYVGLQGGYYNEPVISKYYSYYNIPYYWYNNQSHVPEISVIEQEISEYVKNYLPSCINDFKIFGDSKYEIEQGEISAKTTINELGVQISIDYPIVIKSEGKSVSIDRFSSSVSGDLKKAYDASRLIIEEQKKTPNEMPLGFVAELADEKGFTFETITDGSDVIYSLIFGENNVFIYNFAANYEWEVEDEE